MQTLSVPEARRLALARAGLLKPDWTGLPKSARGRGRGARAAAAKIIDRFGYLQLDTVSIAGARSHGIVLHSRLPGIHREFPEELLRPGCRWFEYWGHEACWIPLDLYPYFDWRRAAFHEHPWWGNLVEAHPEVTRRLLDRIRDEGPIRSAEMEGEGSRGWWDLKLMKKVATALWSAGELAIRERRNFQRSYDLAERVIPEELRRNPASYEESLEVLALRALDGHGWSTTGTISRTWRLQRRGADLTAALERLEAADRVRRCALVLPDGKRRAGWIRPENLELADRLRRVRPPVDRGVLLSPFDPVLWERERVRTLFDFDQILEIFKPAPQRRYGYYCLPVLAGERLVARFDLKADRPKGALHVLSRRFEASRPSAADREAARVALHRYAETVELSPRGPGSR